METEGKSALVPPPPPPPVANAGSEQQATPKRGRVTRPGVRAAKTEERMTRPGVRVTDPNADEGEGEEQSQPPPTPVVQPISEPHNPPPTPEVVLRLGGMHGDRVPMPGDQVWVWMKQDGKLVPFPAQLVWFHSLRGRWGLNVYKIGHILGRHEVSFSETPADCCWTWPLARPEA